MATDFELLGEDEADEPYVPSQWELYAVETDAPTREWWERANAPAFATSIWLKVLYQRADRVQELACKASPMLQYIDDLHRRGPGMDGGRQACDLGRRIGQLPREDREVEVADRRRQWQRDLIAGR